VNRFNLPRYQLTYAAAFDPCRNLAAGAKILEACYTRARPRHAAPLLAALSCYYSGNFATGFRPDRVGQPSYVQKVVDAAGRPVLPIPVVPALPARPVKEGPGPEAPFPVQRLRPADTPPPAPPPPPREEEPPKDPTMVF
jgi:type IV secretion system protein VirB1